MSEIKEGNKVRITDAASVEHIGTISVIEKVDTEYLVYATIVDIEPPVIDHSKHVTELNDWAVRSSDIIRE